MNFVLQKKSLVCNPFNLQDTVKPCSATPLQGFFNTYCGKEENMKINGSKILVETLIEQGVTTVFGYPGGQVINIYDELYNASDRLRHIITSHEQGAAHAADGYARATGEVGVVIATSGPGATNLVTGLATAYLDSTPMVAITGNVPLENLGNDSFQEVDILDVTLPITKHNYIVKDISMLADTIREAFKIAKSGRPGPVLIDIPKNVQIAEYEYTPKAPEPPFPAPTASEEDIEKLAEIINASKRPFIYAGGGVTLSDTSELLLELSEKIDAPIGTSMMGLSAVPRSFGGFVGMTGMHGRYAATKSMFDADLILAIGVRFSDRATGNKSKFATNSKIVHMDIDIAEINKNIRVDYSLIGDLRDTLPRLINRLDDSPKPQWKKTVREYKEYEASKITRSENLNPKTVIEAIRENATADTLVATDVGQHQMWTTQFYDFEKPRKLLTSGGLGTMGFGLGAAIGGAVATGETTVLITGDGSFHMNMSELATAVSNNLPIKIFVFNNNVLGMVRQWQTIFFQKHYSQTTLNRSTDFVKLAEAFGALGLSASTPEEMNRAAKKAFETDGVVLVDCRIDSDEMVLPMIPPNGTIDDIIM